MSSQWGSLAPDGSVSLDLSLVLARPSAFEYVLVHELCHLVHANHSRAYWREVEARFPAWRAERDYFRAHGRALKATARDLGHYRLVRLLDIVMPHLNGVDAVVNLAGESLAGGRWSRVATLRTPRHGLGVAGVTASPLPGPAGNVEYFLWLRRGTATVGEDEIVAEVRRTADLGVPGEKVNP